MSTRCFSNSLFCDVGYRGYSYILSGIGNRSEIKKRCHWRVESGEYRKKSINYNFTEIKIFNNNELSIESLEKVSPYMGGIGISSAIVSFNVALYYNTIIAWCLFYFVQVRKYLPIIDSSCRIYTTKIKI